MTSCSTKPPCCFFGFLRCAEFTNGITRGCTSSPGDGRLQLFLLSSKTDPFGKGVTSDIGPSVPPYCPVRAIVSYPFVTRREGPEQLLFVLSNRQQLTRQSFTVTVWSLVAAAGVPSQSNYSGHSVHICAATTAAMASAPRLLLPSGRSVERAMRVYATSRLQQAHSASYRPGLLPCHGCHDPQLG